MKLVLSTNKKYNRLIVYVTQVLKNELMIEKFYVDENEYFKFSTEIMNKEYYELSYYYQTQRISIGDFFEIFKISQNYDWHEKNPNDELRFLIEINNQLKDIVYQYDGGIIKPIHSESRMLLNKHFEEETKALLTYTENLRLLSNGNESPLINEFNDFAKNDFHSEITSGIFRMFNVGQGNMSSLYLNGDNKPSFIFDLGCSRKCKPAIDLLSTGLNNSKTFVIISHFDNDHINMAKYLPNSGANLHFIVPEFLLPTDVQKPNIQVLMNKIKGNGNNCFIVPNDSIVTPILGFDGLLKIYQGASTKRDSNQSTNENSHCLICSINVNNECILVPGDSLYEDMFTTLKSPLQPNYALIPHHSCNYISAIPTSIIDLSQLKESFTFCTQHRSYHHPNKTHFDNYRINNAKLVRLTRNMDLLKVFDDDNLIDDTFYCVEDSDYYEWNL